MAEENELLTVDEAATKLRVNSDTIRRLMRQKRLPGVKIGGQWRISAAVLRAYMAGGDQKPAVPKGE